MLTKLRAELSSGSAPDAASQPAVEQMTKDLLTVNAELAAVTAQNQEYSLMQLAPKKKASVAQENSPALTKKWLEDMERKCSLLEKQKSEAAEMNDALSEQVGGLKVQLKQMETNQESALHNQNLKELTTRHELQTKCDMLTAQKAEVSAVNSMLEQKVIKLTGQLELHENSSSKLAANCDKLAIENRETAAEKTANQQHTKALELELSTLKAEREALVPELEQLKEFTQLKHHYNKSRYQLLSVCDELKLRMRQIEHDLSRELNAAKAAGRTSFPNEQARLNLKQARNLTEDLVRECNALGGTFTEQQVCMQQLAVD